MKKILESVVIIGVIVIIITIFKKNIKQDKKIDAKENIVKTTSVEEIEKYQNKYSSNKNKVLLLSILGENNEGKIYSDNEINEQLNTYNIKSGIFVVEKSREKFLDILKTCCEADFYFDDGYLKYCCEENNNSIIKLLNNIVISDKTLIITISDTYELPINDIISKFMLEETDYSQNFKYNECIDITLINPENLNETEDLNIKEVYEEILLNIFEYYDI